MPSRHDPAAVPDGEVHPEATSNLPSATTEPTAVPTTASPMDLEIARLSARHRRDRRAALVVAVTGTIVQFAAIFAYDALRGFGDQTTVAAQTMWMFPIGTMIAEMLLGGGIKNPRFEARTTLIAVNVAIIACAWVFLWSGGNWSTATVVDYMVGANTALYAAIANFMSLRVMQYRIATEALLTKRTRDLTH